MRFLLLLLCFSFALPNQSQGLPSDWQVHLRQLERVQTMVGTDACSAPATTRYGKGTEELGQTLPAVLAPNGQNCWTPQTRSSVRKCMAPFYFADSLFQGIRASHWIVGGCTQDYGSFTIGVVSGRLRLKGDARATPFSHAAGMEVSHPHYYAVTLPREQLRLEVTGTSHCAQLRITALRKGLVHIVLEANSPIDGQVRAVGAKGRLVGSNPVRRLYQGMGERAGFSGHCLLRTSAKVESSGAEGGVGWLSIRMEAGQQVVVQAATSFCDLRGATRNLRKEIGRYSFDETKNKLAAQWIERLHRIDTEANDSLSDRLYGALYRASFLPREVSDCDGRYPRFADGRTMKGRGVRYGDFSLWDTFRALHPLLVLLEPTRSGQMMQSLVGMAQEGGWLPIFPCWNSYTAAMIGDHASAALADAWVKGVRNFDGETAYHFMRKNAFESPDAAEYADGKGRRALDSYLKFGYIPLEDSVKAAYHQQEQTSRTLEYAYDDFAIAQMAKAMGRNGDWETLMRRSQNFRNVFSPSDLWADGRHADGTFCGESSLSERAPFITEGARCHYSWFVPHDVAGLIGVMGGQERFCARLDTLFDQRYYWHGNEPCHHIAWLYALAGQPEKTRLRVAQILREEYRETPGGLSGNDDAGQMSAWQIFAMLGLYPLCPGTPDYVLAQPQLRHFRLNLENGRTLAVEVDDEVPYPCAEPLSVTLNGLPIDGPTIAHSALTGGGTLRFSLKK